MKALIFISICLAAFAINTAGKLKLDLKLENPWNVQNACDMTVKINNQRFPAGLDKKGAVACFATTLDPTVGYAADFTSWVKG